MDYSLITAISTAISSARELGKAAIGIRDFNESAAKIAAVNVLLDKAHDSLLLYHAQIAAMQQKVSDLEKTIRQKDEAILHLQIENAEINKRNLDLHEYALFEVTRGVWAYRRTQSTTGAVDSPPYCANCFQEQKLSMLQRYTRSFQGVLKCPKCQLEILDGTFETPSF